MKNILLILSSFTFFTFAEAQKQPNAEPLATAVSTQEGGFVITGKVSDYPDGTIVDFLNGNNGMPEQTTKVAGGTFSFTGKLEFPDFKLISFDKAAPYIPLFLDNSKVSINATKGELEKAVVKGSPTHDDFTEYNRITKPYEKLFTTDEPKDPAAVKKVTSELETFIGKKPNSYVTPLAIFRINQMNDNSEKMEQLFGTLTPEIQSSPIGKYVAQQIEEGKRNPMGKTLADFQQEDPDGKMVSLSSFRGKYVLVDFWASWCGPCRQENPNVVNAFNKYKNKNFTVLGISLDKTKQPWLDAIAKDGLNWTQLSDLKGWSNSVAQQFQIQSIPQNFLIDPNGVVIGKNLRGEALESKLESLLNK
jgi:peroxiredoxin